MSQRVVYLCESFPVLSETFISDQVEQLLSAGAKVKVLSLFEGRNAVLNTRWRSQAQRDEALTTLYRDRPSAHRALLSPALLLRVLSRPSSWATMLHCALNARGVLRDALLYAAWLESHPQQADSLVCHFGPIGYVGSLLRAWGLIQAPQVTVFHGYDLSRILKSRGNGFYKRLFGDLKHHSLAITRHWQRLLHQLGDASAAWIPLGVDNAAIPFRPRGYPADGPIKLITVGRLTEKKGQSDTLRALARLAKDTPWAGRWQYHLVGTGPDEAELKSLASALGLQDQVIFHGGLPHAQTLALLDDSDVFVLTSKTAADGDMEGLPIALMEAMASGMPTLSTRHSGIPELITHYENGLLCDEGDVDALRDNLTAVLDEPQLWERLAMAGRETVQRYYDLHDNALLFADFVEALAQGRPPSVDYELSAGPAAVADQVLPAALVTQSPPASATEA